jgi:hypothetical protein
VKDVALDDRCDTTKDGGWEILPTFGRCGLLIGYFLRNSNLKSRTCINKGGQDWDTGKIVSLISINFKNIYFSFLLTFYN